jgi:hypothetical protein
MLSRSSIKLSTMGQTDPTKTEGRPTCNHFNPTVFHSSAQFTSIRNNGDKSHRLAVSGAPSHPSDRLLDALCIA